MFQGITICMQVREYQQDLGAELNDPQAQHGIYAIKTDTIYVKDKEQTYEYDVTAMGGIGGYCFGLHLETDLDNPEASFIT